MADTNSYRGERVLVTGGDGFVGQFLIAHLEAEGDAVFAPSTDITDAVEFRAMVAEYRPTAVYHLAALANVGDSWNDVSETYRVNVVGTANVLQAVKDLPSPPPVLLVSSAEVYGSEAMNRAAGSPIDEDAPVAPASPYGASKLAAEVVGRQAALGWGVPVVIARSFNHVGAGQSPSFVVSALSQQIAEAEHAGLRSIAVGNLDAIRDFLNVDDVVRAYRLLLRLGKPGATYNVASGEGVLIADVAAFLLSCSSRELTLVVDRDRFRPIDVPSVLGDANRLRFDTGWTPQSTWRDGARACLEHWRLSVDRSLAR